jgi:hypothetical protein
MNFTVRPGRLQVRAPRRATFTNTPFARAPTLTASARIFNWINLRF